MPNLADVCRIGPDFEYQAKREHFVAMMKMHYAATDFLAKHGKLKDAAAALELAEEARIKVRQCTA